MLGPNLGPLLQKVKRKNTWSYLLFSFEVLNVIYTGKCDIISAYVDLRLFGILLLPEV